MGVGIKYVLPMVVTVLTNHDISLSIENPEIHLHPKAQVELMNFILRKCKENNIQLFIETHSDHILNALRIFSKDSGEHDETKIIFVDNNSNIKEIAIDKFGKLSSQYTDFFDEIQKQVVKLL